MLFLYGWFIESSSEVSLNACYVKNLFSENCYNSYIGYINELPLKFKVILTSSLNA